MGVQALSVGAAVTALLLSACDSEPAPPPEPPGAAVDVTGRWIPDDSDVEDRLPQWDARDAVIRFRADGRWDAEDGCNSETGTYKVTGAVLDLSAPGFHGGIGCGYGSVDYLSILGGRALRVERDRRRLTFVDPDGNDVLELTRYEGRPRPYRDVSYRDLVGFWAVRELFGRDVPGAHTFGNLAVGDGEVLTLRGCARVEGALNLGPGGGVSPKLRSETTGLCPADIVSRADLGPNTAKALRHTVRVQVRGDRLVLYDQDHRRIGVYERVRP